MLRYLVLIVFIVSIGAACCAPAAITVTLDGKAVTVPTIDQGGKAFVDVAALMKLLGGSATYTAASRKLAIVSKAPTTVSQPGGDGPKLGEVYKIGKESPLFFSLKSAEYTTEQVVFGEAVYVPAAGEKLLVLHFTVQNPGTADLFVRWDSLKMMAVDAMNVNHECDADWGDEQSHQKVSISLKPKQNLAVYTVIKVPASGPIPKLMVQSPDQDVATTLRYDLRDKVAPLKAPIADPADASGVTALEVVKGALNAAYPYGNLDITVEKSEIITSAVGDYTLEEGERFLAVTTLLRNDAPTNTFVRWDTVQPVVTSTDGEEYEYKDMLLATANRGYSQELKAGAEARVRLLFLVPKDSTPKTLTMKENESRTYEFTTQ